MIPPSQQFDPDPVQLGNISRHECDDFRRVVATVPGAFQIDDTPQFIRSRPMQARL